MPIHGRLDSNSWSFHDSIQPCQFRSDSDSCYFALGTHPSKSHLQIMNCSVSLKFAAALSAICIHVIQHLVDLKDKLMASDIFWATHKFKPFIILNKNYMDKTLSQTIHLLAVKCNVSFCVLGLSGALLVYLSIRIG